MTPGAQLWRVLMFHYDPVILRGWPAIEAAELVSESLDVMLGADSGDKRQATDQPEVASTDL